MPSDFSRCNCTQPPHHRQHNTHPFNHAPPHIGGSGQDISMAAFDFWSNMRAHALEEGLGIRSGTHRDGWEKKV
jgi:hypothetical protein